MGLSQDFVTDGCPLISGRRSQLSEPGAVPKHLFRWLLSGRLSVSGLLEASRIRRWISVCHPF